MTDSNDMVTIQVPRGTLIFTSEATGEVIKAADIQNNTETTKEQ